jgi:uncharacterized protein
LFHLIARPTKKIPPVLRIGLISDTHGLLRREAADFLRGCDRIIHAGDIGGSGILRELDALAPVTAVRGNNDQGAEHDTVADTALVQVGDVWLYVLHDLKQLAIEPAVAGVRVVVSGHSHRPGIEERDGVIYVNPGSAGRRRFALPIAVGELMVSGCRVVPRIVELAVK